MKITRLTNYRIKIYTWLRHGKKKRLSKSSRSIDLSARRKDDFRPGLLCRDIWIRLMKTAHDRKPQTSLSRSHNISRNDDQRMPKPHSQIKWFCIKEKHLLVRYCSPTKYSLFSPFPRTKNSYREIPCGTRKIQQ